MIPAVRPTTARNKTASDEMTTEGCLRPHFTTRSQWFGRLALIGLCPRNRSRSSARSCAVAYRDSGSLAIDLSRIVSRSRGISGLIRLGGAGSSKAIRRRISCRSPPTTAGWSVNSS